MIGPECGSEALSVLYEFEQVRKSFWIREEDADHSGGPSQRSFCPPPLCSICRTQAGSGEQTRLLRGRLGTWQNRPFLSCGDAFAAVCVLSSTARAAPPDGVTGSVWSS